MKLLFIGDIHIRGNNPRNRTDDYKEACKRKLMECWQIAKAENVNAVVCPGDIFHSPEVSISTLLEFAKVFKECPVEFYTAVGNHDVYGYNVNTLGRTSLQLLDLLVPQFHVCTETIPWQDDMFSPVRTDISFVPYSSDVDVNGKGYQVKAGVAVVHGMLLDHDLPYEGKFTNLYTLDTEADIVLSGHDHIGYGVIKRKDGKLFVNPGALMRLTAAKAEIERNVQVAVVDTAARDAKLVPLKTAKPGEEVLDRSRIEEHAELQYAMEEFTALIKENGKVVRLNIPDILEAISKQDKIPADVVSKALKLIGEVEENAG